MNEKIENYQRGEHPNSIKNLRPDAPQKYDEQKKIATFSLTPTGKEGIKKIAQQMKLSQSELIEQIGRGKIQLAITEKVC
jgi:hypothetical protein